LAIGAILAAARSQLFASPVVATVVAAESSLFRILGWNVAKATGARIASRFEATIRASGETLALTVTLAPILATLSIFLTAIAAITFSLTITLAPIFAASAIFLTAIAAVAFSLTVILAPILSTAAIFLSALAAVTFTLAVALAPRLATAAIFLSARTPVALFVAIALAPGVLALAISFPAKTTPLILIPPPPIFISPTILRHVALL
jgi:hypothetical protein